MSAGLVVHSGDTPRSVYLADQVMTPDRLRRRRVKAWVDPVEGRRKLTAALGLLWLVDAALQFQPYMFSLDFPNQQIKPVGAGSPQWVSSPAHWAGTLLAGHIIFWNTLFATTQLAIAVGIFFPKTRKQALALSVVWAVMVWWLGEGLGGVLAGPAAPLMGFPGAVIIYALIALLLWPRTPVDGECDSAASASPLGWLRPKLIWLLLWAAFTFETLRPANRSPSALHTMVAGMEAGEPTWIKSIDRAAAGILAHHGTEFSSILAILFAFIAVSVFIPAVTRIGLMTAVVLAGLIWVFGEDFGTLATGHATDPNSGPPLALFALCFWPLSPHKHAAGATTSRAGPGTPPPSAGRDGW